jgi:hypothetical protein
VIRTHFFFDVFFCVVFLQTSFTRLPETTVVAFEPIRVQLCPTLTACAESAIESIPKTTNTANTLDNLRIIPIQVDLR